MQTNNSSNDHPIKPATTKQLFDDAIQAELTELISETELLFKQLQSLSRHRLAQSGVAQ